MRLFIIAGLVWQLIPASSEKLKTLDGMDDDDDEWEIKCPTTGSFKNGTIIR